MLSVEIVRAMIDYNYACHRRVWESIMALTDEQFTQEIPYSQGSIRNHMVHLATVDGGWLRDLKESPDADTFRYDPVDYPTRESARGLCQRAAEEVIAYVDTLDESALQYQPKELPLTVWQTLIHLVNHGTDHRAQVLRALHDYGAPTFDQDLVYHFLDRSGGV